MEFECNTPVHWLRDARMQASHEIVRVVLLAQVGTFPAGYVGMMDHAASDTHDSVTIIMMEHPRPPQLGWLATIATAGKDELVSKNDYVLR